MWEGLRVDEEVFFGDELEEIVVIVEVVEHGAFVAGDLLELVFFLFLPEFPFLVEGKGLRIQH